jgi:hypothetical protein
MGNFPEMEVLMGILRNVVEVNGGVSSATFDNRRVSLILPIFHHYVG